MDRNVMAGSLEGSTKRRPYSIGMLIWCAIALSTHTRVFSQDSQYPHESPAQSQPPVAELLRRLEQAEDRIRALETRSDPPAQLGGTLLPAHDEVFTASPGGSFIMQHPASVKTDVPASSESLMESARESESRRLVNVGGRIHIDSTLFPTTSRGIGFFENPTTGDDPANRLEFRRLRFDAYGDVTDTVFYKLSLFFPDPNNPLVQDAYIGFRDIPCLQTVLIGNQSRPLGIEVYTGSNSVVFMEGALVFGESNVDASRVGVLSQGHVDDESINWQVGVFEFPNIQDDGLYLNDAFEGSINARVTGTPWYDSSTGGRSYLHLGLNTTYADVNGDLQLQSRPELRTQSRWIDTDAIVDSDWMESTGVEALLNLGSFSIGSEWAGAFVGRTGSSPGLFFSGGYVYVSYFLTGEYQPIDRKTGVLTAVHPINDFAFANGCATGWGAWQIVARVSHMSLTDEDILGGRETNATFGLNWWFNPNSRFMVNYVIGTIDDHRPVGGFTGGHFTGLAMRLQVNW